MKPDWKDAPEWANWLAMDGGGSWKFFENRPCDKKWGNGFKQWEPRGMSYPASVSNPSADWRLTLEARP